MKLTLFINGFDSIVLSNVSNITFSGSTEGYGWNEAQSQNAITFRTNTPDEHIELIKSKFKRDETRFDEFVKLRITFESWEKNTTPKIVIYFCSGSKGMLNPPSFNIED